MTRRISALLLVLAVTTVFAACSDDGGGGGGDSSSSNQPITGAPEVSVTGENLSFTPDELIVTAGDFNVKLTSEDQFHDFEIEDADGLVQASSGKTAASGFTIDDPGEYTFFCTVPGHRAGGMEGTLTVE